MGKLTKIAVAVIGLALGTIAPSQAANIVTNGSFETGDFTGWTQTGDTTFNGVQCPGPGFQPDGNCSAFFGPIGTTGGITQTLTTEAGTLYEIEFSLSSDGATPNSILGSFGGVTFINQSNVPDTNGFQTFSFEVLATGTSTEVVFLFRDDPAFLFFDAVSVDVAAVPEPASLVLVGIGLVGLSLGLRRRILG